MIIKPKVPVSICMSVMLFGKLHFILNIKKSN